MSKCACLACEPSLWLSVREAYVIQRVQERHRTLRPGEHVPFLPAFSLKRYSNFSTALKRGVCTKRNALVLTIVFRLLCLFVFD